MYLFDLTKIRNTHLFKDNVLCRTMMEHWIPRRKSQHMLPLLTRLCFPIKIRWWHSTEKQGLSTNVSPTKNQLLVRPRHSYLDLVSRLNVIVQMSGYQLWSINECYWAMATFRDLYTFSVQGNQQKLTSLNWLRDLDDNIQPRSVKARTSSELISVLTFVMESSVLLYSYFTSPQAPSLFM